MWTNAVIMIRPSGIEFNLETARDNTFQSRQSIGRTELRQAALREFDALAEGLRRSGIEVFVADPPRGEGIPDAVFPNNWFSTHADGTVVIYPMAAANRRAERRADLFDELSSAGYPISRRVDLSSWENEGVFLEGTGSLVLDRTAQIAFASLSPRTSSEGVARWCRLFGFRPCLFRAVHTQAGTTAPIYHTNVLLSLGEGWAVLCLEAVPDAAERRLVTQTLTDTGRDVIAIDPGQMAQFAGNILQLRSGDSDQFVIAMSAAARGALRPDQLNRLAKHSEIVAIDVSTIERCGGGSVRCMLAENYFPYRTLRSCAAVRSD